MNGSVNGIVIFRTLKRVRNGSDLTFYSWQDHMFSPQAGRICAGRCNWPEAVTEICDGFDRGAILDQAEFFSQTGDEYPQVVSFLPGFRASDGSQELTAKKGVDSVRVVTCQLDLDCGATRQTWLDFWRGFT